MSPPPGKLISLLAQFIPQRLLVTAPYNARFLRFSAEAPTMEAEQLNAIANRIADLEKRSSELRRYL
jgi:hypothetical protein